MRYWSVLIITACLLSGSPRIIAAAIQDEAASFPPPLSSYQDDPLSIWAKFQNRISVEPLNLAASLIFLLALIHVFLAPKIMHLSHRWRKEHQDQLQVDGKTAEDKTHQDAVDEVSFKAEVAHFFGEVEAVFGIWVIPLLIVLMIMKGWGTAEHYITRTVHFTEPMFVVVVMALAATRPILLSAEKVMKGVAGLGGGTPAASWFAILTIGPLLGSLITEPAAMTICALLLARNFYDYKPSPRFSYATLGLLFVNISIGGTLTHFAAPPVLMVAGKWGWGIGHMFSQFGWKAAGAILASNLLYFLWFRKELTQFQRIAPEESPQELWEERKDPVPFWITSVHFLFLGWTVFTAHHPAFFIGGFLFFLAFVSATEHHQNPIVLRPALLVGFFLAGLVIHGGLQGWWITPVLTSLGTTTLFFGAEALTALNDNAAITYLASLVPNLSPEMKYAVVAGAVAGGGLTVVANAPNPAGQAILNKYFPMGISPLGLFLGALLPTAMASAFFLLLGR